MKKLLFVCAFVMGISAMSFAQGGRSFTRTPEQQLTNLKTAIAPLTLTDAQSTSLTAAYTAQNKSMDSLRTAMGDDRSGMMEKMRPMMTANTAKINAILTADQAAAYKKYMDAMRAKYQQGGGGN